MSIITTHTIAKSYGPLDVFTGLSLSIPHGARIALVGANGIGKTTLLRVIADKENASVGAVHRSRGITIGYLPQESVLESQRTLWEESLLPFAELQTQAAELSQLEDRMSNPKQVEKLMDRYGALQERFERAGGYSYESHIKQVLAGLGFSEDEYDMPLDHLSGGQRTRALLAHLLLEKPTLLVLDEPTNHLDIQAVEWLENYLEDWDGAALIVSHDRYFIDKVCNHIWEMSPAGFEIYNGNYTHYLQQRQERWERRSKTFEAEKSRLENELDYIKRNMAGQNVAQAKGRLRRLSRQLQGINQIGLDAMRGKSWHQIAAEVDTSTSMMSIEEAHRRIKSLRNPLHRPQEIKLNLRASHRSGKLVLRTYNLRVGYHGNSLFTVPDIILHRLECAALIGPNGAGKTTFLKTILGQLTPLDGDVDLGASLDIGYFAQAHEDLNPEHTLIEEIESVAPGMLIAEIRNYLAQYIFTRDDVFKKVAVLSGGERGRLALAKLALGDANLLLLDEPTNHLDIPAQEILQSVLANFQGTIILVSHDRYLINTLGTQIWEIDKDDASLDVFQGTYNKYRDHQKAPDESDSPNEDRQNLKQKSYRQARAAKNRAQSKNRRRKARVQEIETRVTELETQIAKISAQLAQPPDNPEKVHRLGNDYVEIQNELQALIAEWEQLLQLDSSPSAITRIREVSKRSQETVD
ncbi:MAG: ABC-F family ATP-binding cassette domain-containing protein [Chloroflexota bacterium]|nr:ABC-F family ATP-binding cassette domain-containing protein [Chloroflexota bacterium]